MLFFIWLNISDLYYFYLKVLFNLVYNCCNKLSSSSVNKVTIGPCNFVSLTSNIAIVEALIPATEGSASGSTSLYDLLVITKSADHARVKDT